LASVLVTAGRPIPTLNNDKDNNGNDSRNGSNGNNGNDNSITDITSEMVGCAAAAGLVSNLANIV